MQILHEATQFSALIVICLFYHTMASRTVLVTGLNPGRGQSLLYLLVSLITRYDVCQPLS